MILLKVEKGPLQGQEFRAPEEGKTIIGRSSICDVALVDFKLSRIHCQLEYAEGEMILEDLGSRNGTYLNGKKITGREKASVGDRITVGDTEILIAMPSEAEGGAGEAGSRPRGGQTTFLRDRATCARCKAIIPRRELEQNLAREIDGEMVCSRCLDPLLEVEISGYQLERKLGEGAMGAVYKGVRLSDGHPVALKFLSKSMTSKPEAVKRFLREAASGGALDHPNIVRIFESGVDVDRGLYFLAMEYVEGTNARALITEKEYLNPHQCLSIGFQIGKALEAAFQSGVVHRDIKPANILVSSEGRAKLVDLGTAKSMQQAGLSSLTRTGIGMGTIAYMPPEQIEDAKHADHRSDQYALGASLFHMLTGQRPFGGKTPGEYFRAIRFEKVSWPETPAIPEEAREIVETMLEKSPGDRYQSPAEMIAAMAETLKQL